MVAGEAISRSRNSAEKHPMHTASSTCQARPPSLAGERPSEQAQSGRHTRGLRRHDPPPPPPPRHKRAAAAPPPSPPRPPTITTSQPSIRSAGQPYEVVHRSALLEPLETLSADADATLSQQCGGRRLATHLRNEERALGRGAGGRRSKRMTWPAAGPSGGVPDALSVGVGLPGGCWLARSMRSPGAPPAQTACARPCEAGRCAARRTSESYGWPFAEPSAYLHSVCDCNSCGDTCMAERGRGRVHDG